MIWLEFHDSVDDCRLRVLTVRTYTANCIHFKPVSKRIEKQILAKWLLAKNSPRKSWLVPAFSWRISPYGSLSLQDNYDFTTAIVSLHAYPIRSKLIQIRWYSLRSRRFLGGGLGGKIRVGELRAGSLPARSSPVLVFPPASPPPKNCLLRRLGSILYCNQMIYISLTVSYRYLLIFLKFVQAVIPTIEYDYTRHFAI
jgi:hypothetical protein